LPDEWKGSNCFPDPKLGGDTASLDAGQPVPGFELNASLSHDAKTVCWQTPLGNSWYVQAARAVHFVDAQPCTDAGIPAPCDAEVVRLCHYPIDATVPDTICGAIGPLGCAKCQLRTVPRK
jgi:hypothetical protein